VPSSSLVLDPAVQALGGGAIVNARPQQPRVQTQLQNVATRGRDYAERVCRSLPLNRESHSPSPRRTAARGRALSPASESSALHMVGRDGADAEEKVSSRRGPWVGASCCAAP
jgi:hypothetical protein